MKLKTIGTISFTPDPDTSPSLRAALSEFSAALGEMEVEIVEAVLGMEIGKRLDFEKGGKDGKINHFNRS
jgi:hypothetical protein